MQAKEVGNDLWGAPSHAAFRRDAEGFIKRTCSGDPALGALETVIAMYQTEK